MNDASHSPANDARSCACAVLRDALHDAPTLAALCRELAEVLECHGERFSDEQRAGPLGTEALHRALPLMALARSAPNAFALARSVKQAARRLESLPASADELDALLSGDETKWSAFENLVCGEGTP